MCLFWKNTHLSSVSPIVCLLCLWLTAVHWHLIQIYFNTYLSLRCVCEGLVRAGLWGFFFFCNSYFILLLTVNYKQANLWLASLCHREVRSQSQQQDYLNIMSIISASVCHLCCMIWMEIIQLIHKQAE